MRKALLEPKVDAAPVNGVVEPVGFGAALAEAEPTPATPWTGELGALAPVALATAGGGVPAARPTELPEV